MRKRRECGFTLIELLVAVVLISLLGGIIYAALSQGLRLWKRSMSVNAPIDRDIFFEQFTSDLHNVFNYSLGSFVGEDRAIQFYALRPGKSHPSLRQEDTDNEPVRVAYLWDSNRAHWIRTQQPYQKILYPNAPGPEAKQVYKTGISQPSLEYYAYDTSAKSFRWNPSWTKQRCLPYAIKINFEASAQDFNQKLSKVISIPAGGCQT